jgi:hypothetical protein
MAEYRRIFEEMATILNRNGYAAEERMVREILGALQSDTETFVVAVMGGEIWGASGSVSDCNFRGLSTAGLEEASRDQKRLDALLGSLGKRLKIDGMVSPRIESLAGTYEQWSRTPES